MHFESNLREIRSLALRKLTIPSCVRRSSAPLCGTDKSAGGRAGRRPSAVTCPRSGGVAAPGVRMGGCPVPDPPCVGVAPRPDRVHRRRKEQPVRACRGPRGIPRHPARCACREARKCSCGRTGPSRAGRCSCPGNQHEGGGGERDGTVLVTTTICAGYHPRPAAPGPGWRGVQVPFRSLVGNMNVIGTNTVLVEASHWKLYATI